MKGSHTLQKHKPELFKKLYKKYWNCKEISFDISKMGSSNEANPDTPFKLGF